MNIEPHWLRTARDDLGLRELPGAPTEPRIARWLTDLGAWWRDDATPWCGTACAAWMRKSDIAIPQHWYRAKGWLDWGESLPAPVVGAVVVFGREGGGHVGLVVGRDLSGRLLVLGGNQGDAVSIVPFDPARVLGYRWPSDRIALLPTGPLPIMASSRAASRNEA